MVPGRSVVLERCGRAHHRHGPAPRRGRRADPTLAVEAGHEVVRDGERDHLVGLGARFLEHTVGVGVVVQKVGDHLGGRRARFEPRARVDEPGAQAVAFGVGAFRQAPERDGHRLDRAHDAGKERAAERGIGVARLC